MNLSSLTDSTHLSSDKGVDPSEYSFANPQMAMNHDVFINIKDENEKVSQYISSFKNKNEISLFIVPGFVPSASGPIKLHSAAKKKLNWLVAELQYVKNPVILVTGGNVEPKGTPFNEALEMKHHLMVVHKVPEFLIAIEPYAQNTVTNLRNSGRFMLAHKIKKARIITTFVQNIYIGFPQISSFNWRSHYLLKYLVGQIQYINAHESSYVPSTKVLQHTNSLIDP